MKRTRDDPEPERVLAPFTLVDMLPELVRVELARHLDVGTRAHLAATCHAMRALLWPPPARARVPNVHAVCDFLRHGALRFAKPYLFTIAVAEAHQEDVDAIICAYAANREHATIDSVAAVCQVRNSGDFQLVMATLIELGHDAVLADWAVRRPSHYAMFWRCPSAVLAMARRPDAAEYIAAHPAAVTAFEEWMHNEWPGTKPTLGYRQMLFQDWTDVALLVEHFARRLHVLMGCRNGVSSWYRWNPDSVWQRLVFDAAHVALGRPVTTSIPSDSYVRAVFKTESTNLNIILPALVRMSGLDPARLHPYSHWPWIRRWRAETVQNLYDMWNTSVQYGFYDFTQSQRFETEEHWRQAWLLQDASTKKILHALLLRDADRIPGAQLVLDAYN